MLAKAFYYMELSKSLPYPAREENIVLAHHRYTQAADQFPEDGEKRVYALCCALDVSWQCGVTLEVAPPLMERIRITAPKMKGLGEYSNLAEERDRKIRLYDEAEKDLRERVARGQFTLQDALTPD